jgi:hypothetical protein
MPYIPYIIAAIWLAGCVLMVWSAYIAPEQPDEENHLPQGPDGSSDNGTKS